MPDIHGNYSLTETAKEIGATPAWINRTQRETGVGGRIGRKGRIVSFTEEMIETFCRIKVLRLIGFSFPYIRGLYKMEEDIIRIEKEIGKEYELTNISEAKLPLLLHLKEVAAIGSLFLIELNKKTQQMLYKDKRIKQYADYIDRLCSIAKEALEKEARFMENIDDVTKITRAVFGRFPKNIEENP